MRCVSVFCNGQLATAKLETVGDEMFERIKGWVKGVGRALGLIDNINKLREHKNINADELEYDRIDFN